MGTLSTERTKQGPFQLCFAEFQLLLTTVMSFSTSRDHSAQSRSILLSGVDHRGDELGLFADIIPVMIQSCNI